MPLRLAAGVSTTTGTGLGTGFWARCSVSTFRLRDGADAVIADSAVKVTADMAAAVSPIRPCVTIDDVAATGTAVVSSA